MNMKKIVLKEQPQIRPWSQEKRLYVSSYYTPPSLSLLHILSAENRKAEERGKQGKSVILSRL